MFGRTLLVMEVVTQQHRLRHFEAQVVKCRDVEALQDLAIRLFAENQGARHCTKTSWRASHWPNRAPLSLRTRALTTGTRTTKLIDRPNALTGEQAGTTGFERCDRLRVLDGSVQFSDLGHTAPVLHKPDLLLRHVRGCLARLLHAELPSNS